MNHLRRCEAMVEIPGGKFVQCGAMPVERHHRLTRARGGELLDRYTHYHLMDLCSRHHAMADGGDARAGGLVIDGYVTSCSVCAVPVYVGPDVTLTAYYGKDVHEQIHRGEADP